MRKQHNTTAHQPATSPMCIVCMAEGHADASPYIYEAMSVHTREMVQLCHVHYLDAFINAGKVIKGREVRHG